MMKIKILLTLICISLMLSCYAQQPTDSTADKMLVYQLGNGGWPKQLEDKSVVNYGATLTPELLARIKATKDLHATFDNKATSREVVYLVQAYKKTQNKVYLTAAEKGLDYILSAQYANGGWPQYYPDKTLYRSEITYNDDAMINVLNILQDIVTQKNDFDVVNPAYIKKAEKAVAKGIDCIIKTQVKQNGILTIWGAQYDKDTMLPAKARNFEPASLSTSESMGIIRFLMRFKNPSPEIKTAITAAYNWFNTYKIAGYRFERTTDPTTKEKNAVLVADPTSMVWARFYDLDKNIPIFGDRDNSIKLKLEELIPERRNGYAWYGSWAQKFIEKEYPKWLTTIGK
ncbi:MULTISPECIES: pectate lyase [unclassified Pedobacter]|uniref:pectate lyase n=1 Tax=unclassified Pedobacter TaxID=2628915 RepID=UPI0017C14567|nr:MULTISPECIES: pectate lyase [unclassified Pedobacter]NII84168.1 PelA/Pel-15E family pectate lyase [Pedobacter sp. SG908]NMN38916.1 PelA/Pel-15E family pectate lyase [Pedobacter sp. SG918]